MPWRLTGQMVESCSCNMLCPCWFGVPELAVQDQGWCATAIAFRVREGIADGVDLTGRTAVVAVDFPELMFNGGGTGRLWVEADASAEQRRELEAIIQGKKGGPMGALAPLVATWLPTRTANIAVHDEGDAISFRVGDVGEVASRRLRDAGGNGFALRGGGFVMGMGMEEGELAPSSSHWSDPDMPRQFSTRSGVRGTISWSG